MSNTKKNFNDYYLLSKINSINQLFEVLVDIAHRDTCAVVTISGRAGSGKTTLSKAFAEVSALNALPISLDAWRRESSRNRSSKNSQLRSTLLGEINNTFEWEKLFQDVTILIQTGRLDLFNIYEQTTGELTGNLNLVLSREKPRLIIIEGTRILHLQQNKFADIALLLDIPPEIARRRADRRDRGKKTQEEMDMAYGLRNKRSSAYFSQYGHLADMRLGEKDIRELYSLIYEYASAQSAPMLKCVKLANYGRGSKACPIRISNNLCFG